jgi:RNA polymerase sigma factor (TIGR02999 family)
VDSSPDKPTPLVPAKEGTVRRVNQFSALYDELRVLAARYLTGQRLDHTLQPTALVHEAFMRLVKRKRPEDIDGPDLLRLAARAMRTVLVDHARRRAAAKRIGQRHKVPLDHDVISYATPGIDLIALDEALTRLAKLEPQWSTVIEMRFFGGYSEEQTAELLHLTPRTVRRQWRMAKAWLRNQLEGERYDGG